VKVGRKQIMIDVHDHTGKTILRFHKNYDIFGKKTTQNRHTSLHTLKLTTLLVSVLSVLA
jgi:hypothetical protein